ncbi:MAG: hypothetical protein HQK83_00075 [Fibrobacteria bacterium]|nr:hypothetical protein [Fibrobacteria bacterium]
MASLLPLNSFIEKAPRRLDWHFSSTFKRYRVYPWTITNYNWPGNVRELKNSLERGMLLSKRGPLSVFHFPDLHIAPQIQMTSDDQLCSLEEMEIIYIKKALGFFKGDKHKVCEVLGISLSSLYRKIPKLQEEKN